MANTVPNPNGQADLVAEAIRDAGIGSERISYVEAHGTGTALGDPIEVAGLSKAFAQSAGQGQGQGQPRCALGSVKSNIGHAESAAGIAGLTKVLLQLRHKRLVPSLHAETLNPAIDFTATPFTVQREAAAWEPTIGEGDAVRAIPRMAGISSFGAGGANAHLIVAEHVDRAATPVARAGEPALILLSARSEERLREAARQLLAALSAAPQAELHDIAYTLQVGREAFEARLACVAADTAALADRLAAYLDTGHGEGIPRRAGPAGAGRPHARTARRRRRPARYNAHLDGQGQAR